MRLSRRRWAEPFHREKQTHCSVDLRTPAESRPATHEPHPQSGPPDGRTYRSDSVFPDPQRRVSLQSEKAADFPPARSTADRLQRMFRPLTFYAANTVASKPGSLA